MGEIVFEHFADFADEFLIRAEGSDFKVESEGSVVEVCGADGGDAVIDEHDFLMEKSCLEAEEFHAEGDCLLVVCESGKPDDEMIRAVG